MKRFLVIVMVLIVICSVLLLFLHENDYKVLKFGNNISNKSMDEIVQYILNMQSYEAICEVTVKSNKNENKYMLKQRYYAPNHIVQEVLLPENVQGLVSVYDGTCLTIKNTGLNLQKIYENYQELTQNHLSLNSFIQEYKQTNQNNIEETEAQIVLRLMPESANKYTMQKSLYIDKKTGLPIKLEVQDVTQKALVYILYNEIKINYLKQEDMNLTI